jgi:thioesterase domain-containing protein
MRSFLGTLELAPADIGLAADGDWDLAHMLDALLTRARELGAIPHSATPELLRRLFDVYVANTGALRGCRPGRHDGDVMLFHSTAVTPERLATWAPRIGGRLHTAPIAAAHARLMSPPHVHHIAERLRALASTGA